MTQAVRTYLLEGTPEARAAAAHDLVGVDGMNRKQAEAWLIMKRRSLSASAPAQAART